MLVWQVLNCCLLYLRLCFDDMAPIVLNLNHQHVRPAVSKKRAKPLVFTEAKSTHSWPLVWEEPTCRVLAELLPHLSKRPDPHQYKDSSVRTDVVPTGRIGLPLSLASINCIQRRWACVQCRCLGRGNVSIINTWSSVEMGTLTLSQCMAWEATSSPATGWNVPAPCVCLCMWGCPCCRQALHWPGGEGRVQDSCAAKTYHM